MTSPAAGTTLSRGDFEADLWYQVALAICAVSLPSLVAFNLAPSSTLFNQAAALIGWAGFVTILAASPAMRLISPSMGLVALAAMWLLALIAAIAAPLVAAVPWALARSNVGMILAAALVSLLAAAAQRRTRGNQVFFAFCVGMVAAGVGGSVVALLQVYAPGLADGAWIAKSGLDGRAVGNMRQPNHLSSLLLWGIIAFASLADGNARRRALVWAGAIVLVFVVVLTGSRTGALGTVESSMAKVAVNEALMRIADRRVQVMGGTSVSGDTIVEQVFREVRAFHIYDGPTEVHKWSLAKKIKRDWTSTQ